MPSKKQYDLVSDDGYDSRIPLHNDEAFTHGIPFQAKYIGTLDVPRPSSRVEIVASMRRIRFEFKAKAIKKKKVVLVVSVDGVKVTVRKKKKKVQDYIHGPKVDWNYDESRSLVMNHPIYRIFYVSHDSQDLKIFSYIARDGSTNVFKCNVFKAHKKSQAMRIVRTIGQAFEVCHKISMSTTQPSMEQHDLSSEKSSKTTDTRDKTSVSSPEKVISTAETSPIESSKTSALAQSPVEQAFQQAQEILQQVRPQTLSSSTKAVNELSSHTDASLVDMGPLPLTAQHKIQLLRQQVEQQQQQTQVAMAQVQLLKDQLTAETTARIESQARCHNLMLQNRELLEHMNALVQQMQELEARITSTDLTEYNLLNTHIPCVPMPEVTSPEPGPIFLPGATDLNMESPDSGHKEMSSDSLVYSTNGGNTTVWHSPASRLYGNQSFLSTAPLGSTPNNNYGPVAIAAAAAQNPGNDGYQTPLSGGIVYTVNSNGNPFVTNFDLSGVSNGNVSFEELQQTAGNMIDLENNNKMVMLSPQQHQQLLMQQQQISMNRNKRNAATPRLDPPPRVERSSRSPSTTSTTSKEVVTSPDNNRNHSITSNMSIASASSNSLNESKRSSDTSKLSTDGGGSAKQADNLSKLGSNSTGNMRTADTKRTIPNKDVITNDNSTASQNLKNLNLNLKSLKSPHKRHSSTSAELYSNRDTGGGNETSKLAMQSASESRILGKPRIIVAGVKS